MKKKLWLWCVMCLILVACDEGSESNILEIAGPLDSGRPGLSLSFVPVIGQADYDTGDWYWHFQLILSSFSSETIYITGVYAITTFDS